MGIVRRDKNKLAGRERQINADIAGAERMERNARRMSDPDGRRLELIQVMYRHMSIADMAGRGSALGAYSIIRAHELAIETRSTDFEETLSARVTSINSAIALEMERMVRDDVALGFEVDRMHRGVGNEWSRLARSRSFKSARRDRHINGRAQVLADMGSARQAYLMAVMTGEFEDYENAAQSFLGVAALERCGINEAHDCIRSAEEIANEGGVDITMDIRRARTALRRRELGFFGMVRERSILAAGYMAEILRRAARD